MSMSSRPDPQGPNYMRYTLIILAIVGMIAIAVSTGMVQLEDDIQITVEAPETVTMPPSGTGNMILAYTVSLKNNTEEGHLLEANDPCDVNRWLVADEGGNFVQGEGEEICPQVVMTANLGPGDRVEETVEVPLDAVRYERGGRYQMLMSYWGYEERIIFTVE